jgi:outer membrane protein assembly factor BamB
VLVEDGVAYAAAGMFDYDGIHVYALDAKSGAIRWQEHTTGSVETGEPESGAGVQSHLLLHRGDVYLSGGSQAPLIAFDAETGECAAKGSGRGKDLFVFGGQVRAAGYPLYWRQEDAHLIENAVLESAAGPISIAGPRIALVGEKKDDKGNPVAVWAQEAFADITAAVAAPNAILVAGVDREMVDKELRFRAGIAAFDPADGKELWKHPLPAATVQWGAAVGPDGQIVLTLQDGRVLCFR